MNVSGNTVLITGGSSGIGLELAGAFVSSGNTVLITGTDQTHLDEANQRLPNVRSYQSDITDPDAVSQLRETVLRDFPELNVIVNNAGIMQFIDFRSGELDCDRIAREISINLLGPIRMIAAFLPHLREKERAAIVNVTSGLAFVPLPVAPVYCATKAGMHSFTQSLRVQLRATNIAVFEVTPPITATHLYGPEGRLQRLGLPKAMQPQAVAARVLDGIAKNESEIRPGISNVLKLMSRLAPGVIMNRFSKTVDRVFG